MRPDDAFGASLPVAAVSGTLIDFFGGSAVDGRLQAKTGTLTDVKALAGYLPVDSGGTIEFVLVQNTPGIEQGGFLTVWDDLGKAMATYPAAATEDDLAPR